MLKWKCVAVGVAGALALLAQPALSATVQDRVSELLGTTAEPLQAVDANRAAIVNRLVAEHRATLFASGIAESTFRNALDSLRADQLLAAALVETLAEITTIVSQSERGAASAIMPKDGPGSGANSWIGYTAGSNLASGSGSAVAAGTFNAATTTNAAVFAGQSNVASGISSLVIGGFDNRATAIDSLIGAGAGHRATGARSVVVGGGYNLASGQWSFIGGGGRDGTGSTPAGTDLKDHIASGDFSFIGGGQGNIANGTYGTVGGGLSNAASGSRSTVGGGFDNIASGTRSTVGGGGSNTVGGFYGTVGGGLSNIASGSRSTVGGGEINIASGDFSFAVGYDNLAAGHSSVALGRRSKANANGSFSFADNSNFDFDTNTPDSFRARATGGVRFVTGIDGTGAITWSCLTTDGSGWSCASDRNLKQNLAPLDGRAVLDKLAAMPVYAWSPKGKNAHIRHYGPMAQDFMAAFGLGDDDKMIGMQDADGVALAAIQGLNMKVETIVTELRRENLQLRAELAGLQALREELATIRAALLDKAPVLIGAAVSPHLGD